MFELNENVFVKRYQKYKAICWQVELIYFSFQSNVNTHDMIIIIYNNIICEIVTWEIAEYNILIPILANNIQ